MVLLRLGSTYYQSREQGMGHKFAVGEVVKLKSGGPEMTVRAVPNSGYGDNYNCQWFAGKKLEAGNFPEGSLDKVTPDAP